MIQQWGHLRQWLEENRDSLRIHRRPVEAEGLDVGRVAAADEKAA